MDSSKTMPARPLAADAPSAARLFVYEPTGNREVVTLSAATLEIGRARARDLTLADSRASGRHVRIRRRRDSAQWQVDDLGSTNGTFVDGQPCTSTVVGHGAVVRCGDSLLVFEIGPRLAGDWDEQDTIESALLERVVDRVARTDAPVLFLGPTGAGKGYVAQRAAERASRTGPYVHVNCAALPSELVESELFGHERGAFTGANASKAGLIEEADGGTLFLDEIGTLAPPLQAKLLTAVEEGQIRRVGATRGRKVDVRYMSATNVDIDAAIEAGEFREDLYFRLAAHTVKVPALRKRRPDIVPIFARALGLADHEPISAEVLEALLVWSWPGNVRELLNVAHTLTGDPDALDDYFALPASMTEFLRERARGQTTEQQPRSKKIPPKHELVAALDEADGNVTEVARRMGKHRNQIVRWLDAYGLR